MKIIGAGFSRTGTYSLKHALQILDYQPCYHGEEIFQRPDHVKIWARALHTMPNWKSLFSGYQAGLDSPVCFFWREIRAVFPDAKVILTKRDPNDWYESFEASLYQAMLHPQRAPVEFQPALVMARALVLEHRFAGKFEDKGYAIEIYNRHNESVEASFKAEKANLLVFDVSEGWQSLCEFLGQKIPNTEFPVTNSRQQFNSTLIE